jgi:NAD(P)-dependent dehydrogenase (short-subunit alcohol dehydrogenase family)
MMRASDMLRLDDKVVIVTGCGSIGPGWGNGQAIAALFARQGAEIYGLDRDLAAAQAAEQRIRDEGFAATTAQCDVTDSAAVEDAVADCRARLGRIDILINNVGRSEPGGPVELNEAAWREQLDVNLNSAYLCCRYVLPVMAGQGGGAIVNVSSVAGLRYVGKPQVAYAAAKAALMQMTKTTAVLYADQGIRLNSVVPGLMDTPLVRHLADKYAGGDFAGFTAHRKQQVPMGRMGDAWDVAHAALFLASDEARYVTGEQLVVDGGLTAATR